jgi:biopolymer transport protein ExbD
MVRNQIFALAAVLMSFASAAPEEFVVDPEVYRHDTYDRIHKPQAVYVDSDGTLLFPMSKKLSKGERDTLEKMITLFTREGRAKLELRVYIHPKANWDKVQELVSWLSQQKIEDLSFRQAKLVDGIDE